MAACIVLLIACALPALVLGYSTAAGPPACINLTPQHDGTIAQNSTPPYSLFVDTNSVKKGGMVTVTLNATATDGYFEGFLVQARCTKCSTADTAIVPGTFAKYTASDGTIQTMDCLNVTKNSITHTSEFKKKSVMFTWKVPAGYDVSQGIKFRATVVKSLRTWWNTVMSDEISVTTSSCSRSASAMAVVIGSIIASLLLSHYL
ncbi:putative ferric-chelate reductase 1 isoform X1 [Haliotis rufescens]|uniref:putative ferric-chelate reductase 1 isoform X1 n=1 Tax=Haliotis rufescens TaxID=6454 RepID=UPI00201FB256|nr:putative ferric-chelate reductase 1 isoform X1 [Haliotis rufescens]